MLVSRHDVLRTAQKPVQRNQNIGIIAAVGSLISFYLNGISIVMMSQLIISIWLNFAFYGAFKYLIKNRVFNHKKMLLITDLPTLSFSIFSIGYYVIYGIIVLLSEFTWLELLWVILGLAMGSACFQNGKAFNVLIGNLRAFTFEDSIEVDEEGWDQLKAKLNIK